MNTSLRMTERNLVRKVIATCFAAAVLAGLAACNHGQAESRREHGHQGGQFDSYVLALSWAPAFCAQEGANRSYRECDTRRHTGFIVHGLWPERDNGRILEYCGRVPPVSYAIVEDMLSVMPDRGLIQHEWRAHGSCTGLSAREYFGAIRTAYSRVKIPGLFERSGRPIRTRPAEVEHLFQSASGGTRADSIRIACRQEELTEVRICLSRNLEPIPCSSEIRECHASSLFVRAIP